LIAVLQNWAEVKFLEVEPSTAEYIASLIGEFSNIIQKFPVSSKATNMEISITGYEILLTVFTRESRPEIWAMTQHNLGAAFNDRISGERAENIEKAIIAYENALQVRTKKAFPTHWAITQNNLGNAYANRISGERAENIEKAIIACENSLQVLTKEAFPIHWAGTQNNLGIVYSKRISGDRADNIEKTIVSYENALQVLTKESLPIDWATAQNNLGNAYSDRISGDRADNIEKAISAYENALQVRTEEALPIDWAGTQNNLGAAYNNRISGDRADNIEKAISACENALQVHTKEAFPIDWAGTQNNLGVAYNERISGDRKENLEKAITAYENALGVRTKEALPIDWATIQNNLGNAYSERISGDRADNIEKAIAAYENALQVRTKEAFLIDWAATQNNLGTAYWKRILGERAKNMERAIAGYKEALQVRTREAFPIDWATTQNNLAAAYNDRILGDRTDNLKTAISAYQKALQVRSCEANPIDHLQTTNNLGNLHFTQGDWQPAIDAYEKAIAAVELSRSWASSDDRRQEIMAEAIDVYQKLVQAYINTEQWDKAIETVERSKARNLVELLTKQNLKPKDTPQEIVAELDELRRNIPSLERQLQVATDQLSGNSDGQQRPSLEESQKRLQQELQQSRQELDEVLNEIKPFDSTFSLTERVEVIPFSDIQSLVKQDTAIIEWYVTEEKILTFIIAQSLAIKVSQSETTDLEALNNWLNEYLQDYDQALKKHWSDSLSTRLQQLAEILHLEEILKQVPDNCQQLTLVPHRLLHLLPLHALPLPNQPDKCLLDKFSQGVRYSPSCQLLQLTQNRERSNFSKFFGIQNPTQDLTYASLQVEVIRQQFDSTEVLVETAATKTALIDKESYYQKWLGSAHCVHFACHGDFNENSPLESCLKLANKEPLTLGEIFGLNIDRCRLVALSACETGLTDSKSLSDEYISLPSGFLFAGTPSVINSLWKVDELATAFLTIKFYENLKKYPQREAGEVAIALNQAQMWLRDLTSEDFEKCLDRFAPQIETLLASLSDEFEREIAEISLQNARDRQPRPFASPFYWSGFIATGR
jgi:CHAT domain-containing protein